MLQHDELMLHEKKKTAYLYIRAFEFFFLRWHFKEFSNKYFLILWLLMANKQLEAFIYRVTLRKFCITD